MYMFLGNLTFVENTPSAVLSANSAGYTSLHKLSASLPFSSIYLCFSGCMTSAGQLADLLLQNISPVKFDGDTDNII